MSDYDLWINKGPQAKAARNADQAEQRALEVGTITAEEGIRDEMLADELDDYRKQVESTWDERDAELDDASGQVLDEINRRRTVMGPAYPFDIKGSSVHYRGSATLVYEFCLAVSTMPDKQGGQFRIMEREFERLTGRAVQLFLGTGASSYRTGYSGDDAEDRPARFKAVCEEVKTNIGTGEFQWCPAPDHPEDPDQRYVKDLGIDSVVWKTFGDHRRGNLVLLGQCACGGNWRAKDSDIKLDDLRDYWLRPFTTVPAIRFFAVPFHVPNNTDFSHVNTNYGLTFDRTRISRISEADGLSRAFILDGRQEDYGALIKSVIPGFRAA